MLPDDVNDAINAILAIIVEPARDEFVGV